MYARVCVCVWEERAEYAGGDFYLDWAPVWLLLDCGGVEQSNRSGGGVV